MSNEFDVDGFISGVQQEVPSDKFVPHPVGDYVGSIKDKSVTVRKIDWPSGDTGAEFQCQWVTQGADNPPVKQKFLLDIVRWDEASGTPVLAAGQNKNVRLGKLLAALGLAKPGWSFAQLNGAGPARIKVKHRADKDDAEIVYAEVEAVSKV